MSRIVVILVCLAVVLASAVGSFLYLRQAQSSDLAPVVAPAAKAKTDSAGAPAPKRNRPAPVIPARHVDSLPADNVVWDSEERRQAWEARQQHSAAPAPAK